MCFFCAGNNPLHSPIDSLLVPELAYIKCASMHGLSQLLVSVGEAISNF